QVVAAGGGCVLVPADQVPGPVAVSPAARQVGAHRGRAALQTRLGVSAGIAAGTTRPGGVIRPVLEVGRLGSTSPEVDRAERRERGPDPAIDRALEQTAASRPDSEP